MAAQEKNEVAPAPGAIRPASSPPRPHSSPSGPTTSPDLDASAVPDGGFEAWLVVAGSIVVLFYTWGIINSFGVFQTYYRTDLLRTSSSSDISWIGSLQGALPAMGGVFTGPLYDAGYFRGLIIVGNVLVVLGMFMTSLCTQYWQIILAQGVCVGVGCGIMFLPSAAVVSQWFAKRRGLALGVQSIGSPIAGILLPIMFGRLQPQIGFGWATRAIAFLMLALSVIPITSMKTRVPRAAKRRAFFDKSILTDLPFLLFVAQMFCTYLGMYVPFFYVQLYSVKMGISSTEFSPYLVTILNAGSIFGRVVPNYFADRFGPIQMLIFTTFASAVLIFSWIGIKNLPGLIVFCILYGFFSGGITSGTLAAMVPYVPNLERLGTRMGTFFFAMGVSVLIGTPIGGAILGNGNEASWKGLIAYGGATLLAGDVLLVVSFILHRMAGKKAERV
ncbi:hypothetical protein JX266_005145 [Neoarthrinium moseri]|nr:hypothetical protein JX266_005145 [Neoarthrinium moseri]